MRAVIDDLSHDVPTTLTELRRLGRTLEQRAADVLADFDRSGTSNGPLEAINGRIEQLRVRPRIPQPGQLHRQVTTRYQAASEPTYVLNWDESRKPVMAGHRRTPRASSVV